MQYSHCRQSCKFAKNYLQDSALLSPLQAKIAMRNCARYSSLPITTVSVSIISKREQMQRKKEGWVSPICAESQSGGNGMKINNSGRQLID
jgi:hypothetical protein